MDYATIKYSGAGQPLWTNRYPGSGAYSENRPFAVAVDSNDEVIVGGAYATIKYSSAGEPLWTNFNSGAALVVDGSDNVIVAGGYLETVKYSSAGVPLWTNLCNPNPSNPGRKVRAVAVDHTNDVLVAGYSDSNQSLDYVTIKYSSAGQPLWTNRYNGLGNGYDEPSAVAVDSAHNVIVAGRSTDAGGRYDFVTIKYICVPEPLMTSLQLTNGTFQLRVDDVLQPGTLVIEASSDLAGWAPVFTNTTPANVLFYTDPAASNYLRRFYRALQWP